MSSAFSTRDCAAHLFITLYCSAAFLAGTRASSLFRQASYSLCSSIHASVFRPCLPRSRTMTIMLFMSGLRINRKCSLCAALLFSTDKIKAGPGDGSRGDHLVDLRERDRLQIWGSGSTPISIFGVVLLRRKKAVAANRKNSSPRRTRPTSSRSRAQAYVHHASAIHGPAA